MYFNMSFLSCEDLPQVLSSMEKQIIGKEMKKKCRWKNL